MNLFDSLRHFFLEQGTHRRYIIGYSGGLDSTVLLHLSAELRQLYPLLLTAVYIHHGLSARADHWRAHCEDQCNALQIPFIDRAVHVSREPGRSLEEEARKERYAIFLEHLNPEDILLTAHHQDDQAETLLVQLSRGAGIKGMAAMPSIKSFGLGFHARPLLSFSRDDLERYARDHELDWIEDESNHDIQLTRNFFRKDILPLLKKRWPSIATTFSRAAAHCAESQELLDHFAKSDLQACQSDRVDCVSIKALKCLELNRQRHVLRYWLSSLGFIMPTTAVLHRIQQDFLTAAIDKLPYIKWGEAELRRYQDQLMAMRCLHWIKPMAVSWDLKSDCVLDHGRLTATRALGRGIKNHSTLTVSFREGGERCYIGQMHRSLKNLFQEWAVPPWERDRIPLLYSEGELIAVVGYFIRDDCLAKESEEGWVIQYKM